MISVKPIAYLCSHLTDEISLASVADLLEQGVSSPQAWFVKADDSLEIPANTLSKYALANILLKGYSLQLRQVQKLSTRFSLVKSLVEKQLGQMINVNIYLTPPHSKALPLHSDNYDVLVYQACGEKHWKIAQQQTLLLTPGDAFYLKKGIEHEATTAAYFSLHFTFGVTGEATDSDVTEAPLATATPVISDYAHWLRSRLSYSTFCENANIKWVSSPRIQLQGDLITISVDCEGVDITVSLPSQYGPAIDDFCCLKQWRLLDLHDSEHKQQLIRYLVKEGIFVVS